MRAKKRGRASGMARHEMSKLCARKQKGVRPEMECHAIPDVFVNLKPDELRYVAKCDVFAPDEYAFEVAPKHANRRNIDAGGVCGHHHVANLGIRLLRYTRLERCRKLHDSNRVFVANATCRRV